MRAAAGSHGIGFTLPVSVGIVALLAVLIASYRQLIAAFPDVVAVRTRSPNAIWGHAPRRPRGYPMAVLLMVVASVALYVVFRRQKWL